MVVRTSVHGLTKWQPWRGRCKPSTVQVGLCSGEGGTGAAGPHRGDLGQGEGARGHLLNVRQLDQQLDADRGWEINCREKGMGARQRRLGGTVCSPQGQALPLCTKRWISVRMSCRAKPFSVFSSVISEMRASKGLGSRLFRVKSRSPSLRQPQGPSPASSTQPS